MNSIVGRDPVGLAIKHMKLVAEAAKAAKQAGEGVRRRARELPSLMLQAGLVPTLTFFMSKAEENEFMEWFSYLRNPQPTNRPSSDLKGEGGGYSVLLAMIFDAMEKLAGVNVGSVSGFTDLLKILLGIGSGRGESLRISRILMPYLVEVKKLATALLG